MNFIKFKNHFKNNILISKDQIKIQFPGFDNKNITYWQNKGYIKKIINKYYIFSDKNLNSNKLFHISNNIYFPSYISSYSGLSYYNIIPEQVVQIIGISTNATRTFNTAIGTFKYHNIKANLFWGYDIIKFGKNSFYIADIEKTILDFFYLNKQYRTIDDIDSLRLDINRIKTLVETDKFIKYLKIFNNNTLSKTIFILLDLIKNA